MALYYRRHLGKGRREGRRREGEKERRREGEKERREKEGEEGEERREKEREEGEESRRGGSSLLGGHCRNTSYLVLLSFKMLKDERTWDVGYDCVTHLGGGRGRGLLKVDVMSRQLVSDVC